MTDTTTTTTTTTANTTSHAAYRVRDRWGQKGIFTRIGTAWAQKDGKGYGVQLDCVPLDGRISLRVLDDKQD